MNYILHLKMPKLPVTIKTISKKQTQEIESIAKQRLMTPGEVLTDCLRTKINQQSIRNNEPKSELNS